MFWISNKPRSDYDIGYSHGVDKGFKNGYEVGYGIAKHELPAKLEQNIKLLVSMLEQINCNIKVFDDEVATISLQKNTYETPDGVYYMYQKKIMIKIEPMGYVMTGTVDVIDDIKSVLKKVKL